ncbi:unannotated protein [freshwater metagenome]|uniref:Unannotated protein n=1 Tax=freshwater metagenome TaxID=449393 RepID=A0A6J6C1L0_9ZZZZ
MKMTDRPLPLRCMIFFWPLMLALGACTVADSTPKEPIGVTEAPNESIGVTEAPNEPIGVTEAPNAPMSSVLEQTIDEARPAGAVFDQSFEEEADGGLIRFNTQRWKYVAANEADLVAAANQLLDTAVQQGWTLLDPYPDSSASGIYTATLAKGQMYLTLDYATTASFARNPDDEDELRLNAEILLDPSRENGG